VNTIEQEFQYMDTKIERLQKRVRFLSIVCCLVAGSVAPMLGYTVAATLSNNHKIAQITQLYDKLDELMVEVEALSKIDQQLVDVLNTPPEDEDDEEIIEPTVVR